MSRSFIAAGEVIHAKNGAVFATVARDLHPGDIVRRNDFIFADGYMPQFGQSLPQPVVDFLNGR
jgi:AAA+ superfamily predicted ATPase